MGLILGGGTQAFCPNAAGCNVLTWDPSLTAEENFANSRTITLPDSLS